MLSFYRIRHCKLPIFKILNKWIEAACVHMCGKYNSTVLNIFRIYMDYADMLAVYRRMEEIQFAVCIKTVSYNALMRLPQKISPAD